MRKTTKLIIGLVAAMTVISCAKEDNTLRYNNATMGNVTDGVFISDQGNRFNVISQTCGGRLEEMKRAFIICDVLNTTAGTTDEYDVRLNYIANVLDKNAKPVSDIEDLATYMNDPIILNDIWISGGYINFVITVPIKAENGKSHELNLLYEKKENEYIFKIRHDAAGEIYSETETGNTLVLANAYASFPIASIIPEETAKIAVEWKSYIFTAGYLSSQTDEASEKIIYTKSTFEQVPSTAVPTTLEVRLR